MLALTPAELMCEVCAKPGLMRVGTAKPEFSWCFKDGVNGDFQSAYQVQVATGTPLLYGNTPDMWDSGRVDSPQSLHIAYNGASLPEGATLCWRVRVWDRRGRQGAWSHLAAFVFDSSQRGNTSPYYPLTHTAHQPYRITTNSSGRVFVDFGRAVFGWVELASPLDFAKGGDFILRIGERAGNGFVESEPGGAIRYARVEGTMSEPGICRVPMERSAATLISFEERDAQLPPEYGVVMPFRYVEVEKAPFPITDETIKQVAVHYPFDSKAAGFVSSDPALDSVYSLCKHTIFATTFAGIYVDGDRCRAPREADAYVNQLGHYCCDREYTLARYTFDYLMENPSRAVDWQQQMIAVAWHDWMWSGSTRLLTRYYDQLKEGESRRGAERESDGLLTLDGGGEAGPGGVRAMVDWPPGERDGFEFKPVNAVVNAFHCRNLRMMAEMAEALGKRDDAELYQGKAERAATAFHRVFYNEARGAYLDGEGATHASLHANMLPLAFGLVPEAEVDNVARFVKNRGISCGVYGAQFLLEALFESGEEESAIGLMVTSEVRGWMNMLRTGSTMTTEAWDLKLQPDLDWSHAWATAPVNILPRYVMGVRPLEPGFGKMRIRPQVGRLKAVQGLLPTVRGPVVVGVRQEPGVWYRVSFEIPPNTTADVELPARMMGRGRVVLDNRVVQPETGAAGTLLIGNVESGSHVVVWELEAGGCASSGTSGSRWIPEGGWRAWLPFF